VIQFFILLIVIAVIAAWTSIRTNESAGKYVDDSVITTKVEPLGQEPEDPFQNATSRDWQKTFNPQREFGAFGSGVKSMLVADDFLKSFQISAKTYQGTIQLSGYVNSNKAVDKAAEIVKKRQRFQPHKELSNREIEGGEIP
jgi:hyperosmotically inducible protein